ncbi:hypothetical protein ROR02_23050 [Pararhodospirillum oryzae]|uniref:Methyltransferase type 11 domain-containing protein n=2 Tax=Pararhodospirillum oryzae TaxID=478448 RepID=A0A512H9P6_9PROT|nr:hypothetical protein ROR02_23050 [Pararhodospirillum oryzae]
MLGGRFTLSSYTGIDINPQAIATGREAGDLPPETRLLVGDVVEDASLASQGFDMVVNLSCADWNLDTAGILAASWARVAPGGVMVVSLRLTPGASVTSLAQSFQYIHYGDDPVPEGCEKAAYVVLNLNTALSMLSTLPETRRLVAYGYWGKPSATARTPVERVLFGVLAVERDRAPRPADDPVQLDLSFPRDAWLP